MIKETQPTRAESHDVYSTLKEGAQGLVLAAETAIGVDPVGCVKFLKKDVLTFLKKKKKFMLNTNKKGITFLNLNKYEKNFFIYGGLYKTATEYLAQNYFDKLDKKNMKFLPTIKVVIKFFTTLFLILFIQN